MDNNYEFENSLLDFELLSKLIVGIGEVADITGVPQRQIRYWEDKGIVESVKDGEGSTRRFNYLNVKKIILIKELLEDGFTLDSAAKRVNERMKTIIEVFSRLSNQT